MNSKEGATMGRGRLAASKWSVAVKYGEENSRKETSDGLLEKLRKKQKTMIQMGMPLKR